MKILAKIFDLVISKLTLFGQLMLSIVTQSPIL